MAGILDTDKLYEQGMVIVNQIVKNLSYTERLDPAEMMSAGMDGVMYAVENFKKGDFPRYVKKCIRKRIGWRICEVYKKDCLVSLSDLPEKYHPLTKDKPLPDERVAKILKAVNKKEREVLSLVSEGYTYTQIAKMINCDGTNTKEDEVGCTKRTIIRIINSARKKCKDIKG